MSTFSDNKSEWIYRIFDRRTISVKSKNEQVRKIASLDLSTNLPFAIDIPANLEMDEIKTDQAYYASLKIYTAKNVNGIAPEFIEFFEVVDVDQSMENFIKAYWLYPKLIKFELVEVEPI